MLEEIMDVKELVCLNDGTGTKVNVIKGTESALDPTVVSQSLAGKVNWELYKGSTISSDHYPIFIKVGVEMEGEQDGKEGRWRFEEADWDKFRGIAEERIEKIQIDQSLIN